MKKNAECDLQFYSDIIEWLQNLDGLVGKLCARGYAVPEYFLSTVESIRQRTPDEKSFEYYAIEKTKEEVWLKGLFNTFWSPRNRQRLPSEYRSAYLDRLQNLIPTWDFPIDKDYFFRSTLDPNDALFSAWVVTDDLLAGRDYGGFMTNVHHKKYMEYDFLLKEFNFPCLKLFAPTPAKTLGFIRCCAETSDIEVIKLEKGTKPTIVLQALVAPNLALNLSWDDYSSLNTNERVLTKCFLVRPDKSSSDVISPTFQLGIDGLIPGSFYYVDWQTSPTSGPLSICFQVELLKALKIEPTALSQAV